MTDKRETLCLIDGMSHIFRAYYAIRGLSTSKGMATNAVYGFTVMLRKIIQQQAPTYIAVVLDSPEPTFRHEAYADYKANRGLMPDDLSAQIPYVLKVCDALRFPVVRLSGFEADDLIGTLARKAEASDIDTVIVTQDKDLCQLVTEHILVLREERGGTAKLLDRDGVIERMGVPPDQVVDLLGLQGDSSDNIPGAPGIGEKGALQLIQEFGSIAAALEGWENVKRKSYRESLRDNRAIIEQSRELARIKTDCPVELDLDALTLREPDRLACFELFSELEFGTLAREFADAAIESAPVQRTVERDYDRIWAASEIKKLAQSIWNAGRFAFAVNSSDAGVRGIAIATSPNRATYVDFDKAEDRKAAFDTLVELLENGLIEKVVHDAKDALHALNAFREALDADRRAAVVAAVSSCGGRFPWDGAVRVEPVTVDTMLASYLLDPNRSKYLLSDLSREMLGVEFSSEHEGFDKAELDTLQTADAATQLADRLPALLESRGLTDVYERMELPLIDILYEIERTGLLLDREALADVGVGMDADIGRLASRIYEVAGREFNINSPQQLADILDEMNLPMSKRTATGKISTSKDVLEELAVDFELPKLVIEYRELAKLKGTYVDALPELVNADTGRIHTTLNQAVAATGRLSSTNPNLQNIPVRTEAGRSIRRAFVAAPGCVLISADYSQIELRVLAHIAEDDRMREAFRLGEDIHAATARAVFGAETEGEEKEKRRLAKIVNFAIAYSVGAFGLAQRTGLSRKAAKQAIETYYDTFKGVRKYMDDTPESAREAGEVRTLFGRLRQIPDIDNRNHNLRARAEREAINAPIQGTAADIMKLAMIAVRDALDRDPASGRIVMQVHDELLVEAPEAEVERTAALLKTAMEGVTTLAVPLVVDVGAGKNWMDAK